MSRKPSLDTRGAGVWLGCGPAQIRSLKRKGWLKSVAQLSGRGDQKLAEDRFYLVDLQALVADIAFGLSIYDILAIRKTNRTPANLAKASGIPERVITYVRERKVFALIEMFLKRYADDRANGLDDLEKYLPNVDPITLSSILPLFFAQNPVRLCRDLANPSRILTGSVFSKLAPSGKTSVQRLTECKGFAGSSKKARHQELVDWLAYSQEWEVSGGVPPSHEHPTELPYQIAKKRVQAARGANGPAPKTRRGRPPKLRRRR